MEAALSTSKYCRSSSTNKDIISANVLACTNLLQLLRSRSSGIVGGDEKIQLRDIFEQEMIHVLQEDDNKVFSSSIIEGISPFQAGALFLSVGVFVVAGGNSQQLLAVLDSLYLAAAEENKRIFLLVAATAIKVFLILLSHT